jgi:hypothetical protein
MFHVRNCGVSAILGALIASFVFSFGFVLLEGILDLFLTPPLMRVGNYGQFGFVIVIFGMFGFVGGLTCGLVPILGRTLWIPIFLTVMILFLMYGYNVKTAEFLEVSNCAYMICCLGFAGLEFLFWPRELVAPRDKTDLKQILNKNCDR